MLNDIQRRQMESEGTHPAQQAAHQKISGVAAPILEQTAGGKLDVGQKFVRILIGIGSAFVAGLQAIADLAEKHPVRHAIVAGGRQRLRPGNTAP